MILAMMLMLAIAIVVCFVCLLVWAYEIDNPNEADCLPEDWERGTLIP